MKFSVVTTLLTSVSVAAAKTPTIMDNRPKIDARNGPKVVDNRPKIDARNGPKIVDNRPKIDARDSPKVVVNLPKVDARDESIGLNTRSQNDTEIIEARNPYEVGILIYGQMGCAGPGGDLNHDWDTGNDYLANTAIYSCKVKDDGIKAGVGCLTVYEDARCHDHIGNGRFKNYNVFKDQCIDFYDAGFTVGCLVLGPGDGRGCELNPYPAAPAPLGT